MQSEFVRDTVEHTPYRYYKMQNPEGEGVSKFSSSKKHLIASAFVEIFLNNTSTTDTTSSPPPCLTVWFWYLGWSRFNVCVSYKISSIIGSLWVAMFWVLWYIRKFLCPPVILCSVLVDSSVPIRSLLYLYSPPYLCPWTWLQRSWTYHQMTHYSWRTSLLSFVFEQDEE